MGKGGGSGGGTTQTISKADPWSGIQPFLTGSEGQKGIYQLGADWYNSQDPSYYPGSTVADRSWETEVGLNNQDRIASAGSAGIDAANNQALRTMNGDFMENNATRALGDMAQNGNPLLQRQAEGQFLNKNPYVDAMFGKAAGDVSKQYQNTVMPQLASMYSQAGRYGSGAMNQATSTAQGNYGDTLNNLSTSIYGQNYANERSAMDNAAATIGQQKLGAGTALGALYSGERGNMMSASQMAPGLQNAKFQNNDRLLQTGAVQDARAQQLLNADISRYDFNQNKSLNKLQNYNSILQGGINAGGTQNSQTTGPGQQGNFLSGAMGGASLMSGLGGLASGAFGPSLVGMGMGSAGLSGLGALGGPIGMGLGALLGGIFS